MPQGLPQVGAATTSHCLPSPSPSPSLSQIATLRRLQRDIFSDLTRLKDLLTAIEDELSPPDPSHSSSTSSGSGSNLTRLHRHLSSRVPLSHQLGPISIWNAGRRPLSRGQGRGKEQHTGREKEEAAGVEGEEGEEGRGVGVGASTGALASAAGAAGVAARAISALPLLSPEREVAEAAAAAAAASGVTRFRGVVTAGSAYLPASMAVRREACGTMDAAGMRTGLTGRFIFETVTGGGGRGRGGEEREGEEEGGRGGSPSGSRGGSAGVLTTELVTGDGEESGSLMLGGPLKLSKVKYGVRVREGVRAMVAPMGANGEDVVEATNAVQVGERGRRRRAGER